MIFDDKSKNSKGVQTPRAASFHEARTLPAGSQSPALVIPQVRRRGRPRKPRPLELSNLPQSSITQDRLKVLALYVEGKYSYQDIAWATGRSRDSVRAWIRAWKSGGVNALLRRAERPARVPHRFTPEARQSLLEAVAEHRWSTAQQAWQWVRDDLGIDVCYLTVWRFLASQGLFSGGVMHSRKLNPAEALVTA